MHDAHAQGWLMDCILMSIVTAYLGIAYQFWVRRRDTMGRASSALEKLVIIFVFCALCGYVSKIVPVPDLVLIAAHIVLSLSAWTYFFSGSVDRLTVALDFADQNSSNHLMRRQALEEALDVETEACARIVENTDPSIASDVIRKRLDQRRRRRDTAAAASDNGRSLAA